jgi:predicted CopG family antitoxin
MLMNELNNLQHSNKLRTIVISQQNYVKLKRLGYTSASFNDVVSRLLENVKNDARVSLI